MKKNFVKSRWFFTMLLFVTTMIMPTMMLAKSITPTPPKGEGTVENPYQISNAAELYWFARLVNGGGNASANAILTDNITVNTGVLDENKNLASKGDLTEWEPIGTCDVPYTGTFDGKGYTISGLYFNNPSESNVGLFGYIEANGKISNVGVLDSYFKFDMLGGGVCGTNNGGELQNCSNSSTVIGNRIAGGVCGTTYSGGTIKNCKNTGYVKGTSDFAGGVCGINHNVINYCYYLSDTATGGIGNQKDEKDKAEIMFKKQFESGEVAWLLNGKGLGEQVWGQHLGIDPSPVPGSDYKVIKAAQGDNDTYWATFSNLTNDANLSVPSDRKLYVYNATVSGGKMTLTQRSDDQVAKEEGVLLKTDGEYVNAKAKETNGLTAASSDENHLVATPAEAQTVTATGYILYRLTYKNDTNKEGLGFYLGVDKANNSYNGTRLKATPGKAYLKVSENEAKDPSSAALTRSFVFGGGSETTGIEEITIMGTDVQRHGTIEGIFDLQGRKISNPTKGIYIKNNKKVIIK